MSDPLPKRGLMKEVETAEATPEEVFEQRIDQLQGPIEGFRDDFVVMYKTAGTEI